MHPGASCPALLGARLLAAGGDQAKISASAVLPLPLLTEMLAVTVGAHDRIIRWTGGELLRVCRLPGVWAPGDLPDPWARPCLAGPGCGLTGRMRPTNVGWAGLRS